MKSFFDTLFDGGTMTWAEYGDFFGGVVGTVLAGLSLLVLAITWFRSHSKAIEDQMGAVISQYRENHVQIVSGMKYGALEGREVFRVILSEFGRALRITRSTATELGVRLREKDAFNIAYHFVYYGSSPTGKGAIYRDYPELGRIVQARISQARIFKSIGEGPVVQVSKMGRDFKGHQQNLGHYFRNLWAVYQEIERSSFSFGRKYLLSKRIRATLSNYEQALLGINSLSTLGAKWEEAGLLEKYQLLKNIPEGFFDFEGDGSARPVPIEKQLFPRIQFEWEHTSAYLRRRMKLMEISIRYGQEDFNQNAVKREVCLRIGFVKYRAVLLRQSYELRDKEMV